MKKRTFIKISAALGAEALLQPVPWSRLSWGAGAELPEKLKNWAGNIEYHTENLYAAKSVQEVQHYVAGRSKLKVLGTRHCFNTLADSKDGFLSLKPMEEMAMIDSTAHTVTVDAGVTYGQLAPYLHEKGFALHNLASLPHISVAGACSTATHGSGEKNGNLAIQIAGLQMVTAAGDVVEFSRKKDAEAFNGVVVGLGALGVITKITLRIQPTFTMRQYVYENMPLESVKTHFDEIEASGYSVSLFTDWRNKRINEVWIKSRVDTGEGAGEGAEKRAGKEFEPKREFFGGKLATKNLHPIAELSAENCTEQMGVPGPWFERLPHFKMGFTPSAGKELQSEFFVPRTHAVEAILAVEKLHEKISPHLLITEIRTIAADNFWMSPCYQQDSVAIHFTWQQDWPAVKSVLPEIEMALAAFGVRPHWGKLFTLSPAELRTKYKRLPEFIELSKRYDPQGKFRNDFLNTYIFGS